MMTRFNGSQSPTDPVAHFDAITQDNEQVDQVSIDTVPRPQDEPVDRTDAQGRNPGEPGFGDADDGHIHDDDTNPQTPDESDDTLSHDAI